MEIIEISRDDLVKIIKEALTDLFRVNLDLNTDDSSDAACLNTHVEIKRFPKASQNGGTFVLTNAMGEVREKLNKILKDDLFLVEITKKLGSQIEEKFLYLVKESMNEDVKNKIVNKIKVLNGPGVLNMIKTSEMLVGVLLHDPDFQK